MSGVILRRKRFVGKCFEAGKVLCQKHCVGKRLVGKRFASAPPKQLLKIILLSNTYQMLTNERSVKLHNV